MQELNYHPDNRNYEKELISKMILRKLRTLKCCAASHMLAPVTVQIKLKVETRTFQAQCTHFWEQECLSSQDDKISHNNNP
jgi:hypothetical protein